MFHTTQTRTSLNPHLQRCETKSKLYKIEADTIIILSQPKKPESLFPCPQAPYVGRGCTLTAHVRAVHSEKTLTRSSRSCARLASCCGRPRAGARARPPRVSMPGPSSCHAGSRRRGVAALRCGTPTRDSAAHAGHHHHARAGDERSPAHGEESREETGRVGGVKGHATACGDFAHRASLLSL